MVQVLPSLDLSERSAPICGPGLLVQQMQSSNESGWPSLVANQSLCLKTVLSTGSKEVYLDDVCAAGLFH
jgi:hypothetical protein